jgi:hypothetical protein
MVAEVVRVTLEELHDAGSTHWSTRTLAKRLGVGKGTVAHIWAHYHLKPWISDTFEVFTGPHFEEKLSTSSACTWTR